MSQLSKNPPEGNIAFIELVEDMFQRLPMPSTNLGTEIHRTKASLRLYFGLLERVTSPRAVAGPGLVKRNAENIHSNCIHRRY